MSRIEGDQIGQHDIPAQPVVQDSFAPPAGTSRHGSRSSSPARQPRATTPARTLHDMPNEVLMNVIGHIGAANPPGQAPSDAARAVGHLQSVSKGMAAVTREGLRDEPDLAQEVSRSTAYKIAWQPPEQFAGSMRRLVQTGHVQVPLRALGCDHADLLQKMVQDGELDTVRSLDIDAGSFSVNPDETAFLKTLTSRHSIRDVSVTMSGTIIGDGMMLYDQVATLAEDLKQSAITSLTIKHGSSPDAIPKLIESMKGARLKKLDVVDARIHDKAHQQALMRTAKDEGITLVKPQDWDDLEDPAVA